MTLTAVSGHQINPEHLAYQRRMFGLLSPGLVEQLDATAVEQRQQLSVDLGLRLLGGLSRGAELPPCFPKLPNSFRAVRRECGAREHGLMPLRRELVAVHFLHRLAAGPTEAAVHATGDGPRHWREQAGTQEEMAMMIRAQWTLIGILLVAAARGLGAEVESGRPVGVYLAGANLQGGEFVDGAFAGADLRDANLQGAYVIGGELAEATLANTNLQGGYLPDANLDDADLQRANLQEVDLQGATLKNADLTGAVLQGANLRGADLGGVRLDGTYLQGASLAGVRGLTQAQLDRACVDSTIDLTGTGLRIPRSRPCCSEPGGCGR